MEGQQILGIIGALTLSALGVVSLFGFIVVGVQAGIVVGRKLFGRGLTD